MWADPSSPRPSTTGYSSPPATVPTPIYASQRHLFSHGPQPHHPTMHAVGGPSQVGYSHHAPLFTPSPPQHLQPQTTAKNKYATASTKKQAAHAAHSSTVPPTQSAESVVDDFFHELGLAGSPRMLSPSVGSRPTARGRRSEGTTVIAFGRHHSLVPIGPSVPAPQLKHPFVPPLAGGQPAIAAQRFQNYLPPGVRYGAGGTFQTDDATSRRFTRDTLADPLSARRSTSMSPMRSSRNLASAGVAKRRPSLASGSEDLYAVAALAGYPVAPTVASSAGTTDGGSGGGGAGPSSVSAILSSVMLPTPPISKQATGTTSRVGRGQRHPSFHAMVSPIAAATARRRSTGTDSPAEPAMFTVVPHVTAPGAPVFGVTNAYVAPYLSLATMAPRTQPAPPQQYVRHQLTNRALLASLIAPSGLARAPLPVDAATLERLLALPTSLHPSGAALAASSEAAFAAHVACQDAFAETVAQILHHLETNPPPREPQHMFADMEELLTYLREQAEIAMQAQAQAQVLAQVRTQPPGVQTPATNTNAVPSTSSATSSVQQSTSTTDASSPTVHTEALLDLLRNQDVSHVFSAARTSTSASSSSEGASPDLSRLTADELLVAAREADYTIDEHAVGIVREIQEHNKLAAQQQQQLQSGASPVPFADVGADGRSTRVSSTSSDPTASVGGAVSTFSEPVTAYEVHTVRDLCGLVGQISRAHTERADLAHLIATDATARDVVDFLPRSHLFARKVVVSVRELRTLCDACGEKRRYVLRILKDISNKVEQDRAQIRQAQANSSASDSTNSSAGVTSPLGASAGSDASATVASASGSLLPALSQPVGASGVSSSSVSAAGVSSSSSESLSLSSFVGREDWLSHDMKDLTQKVRLLYRLKQEQEQGDQTNSPMIDVAATNDTAPTGVDTEAAAMAEARESELAAARERELAAERELLAERERVAEQEAAAALLASQAREQAERDRVAEEERNASLAAAASAQTSPTPIPTAINESPSVGTAHDGSTTNDVSGSSAHTRTSSVSFPHLTPSDVALAQLVTRLLSEVGFDAVSAERIASSSSLLRALREVAPNETTLRDDLTRLLAASEAQIGEARDTLRREVEAIRRAAARDHTPAWSDARTREALCARLEALEVPRRLAVVEAARVREEQVAQEAAQEIARVAAKVAAEKAAQEAAVVAATTEAYTRVSLIDNSRRRTAQKLHFEAAPVPLAATPAEAKDTVVPPTTSADLSSADADQPASSANETPADALASMIRRAGKSKRASLRAEPPATERPADDAAQPGTLSSRKARGRRNSLLSAGREEGAAGPDAAAASPARSGEVAPAPQEDLDGLPPLTPEVKLVFDVHCEGLDSLHLLRASSPYLELYLCTDAKPTDDPQAAAANKLGLATVSGVGDARHYFESAYKTETHRSTSSPIFRRIILAAQGLCRSDYDRPILFRVWDDVRAHDGTPNPCMGEVRATLRDLMRPLYAAWPNAVDAVKVPLVRPEMRSKRGYTHSGLLVFTSVMRYRAIDHIPSALSPKSAALMSPAVLGGESRRVKKTRAGRQTMFGWRKEDLPEMGANGTAGANLNPNVPHDATDASHATSVDATAAATIIIDSPKESPKSPEEEEKAIATPASPRGDRHRERSRGKSRDRRPKSKSKKRRSRRDGSLVTEEATAATAAIAAAAATDDATDAAPSSPVAATSSPRSEQRHHLGVVTLCGRGLPKPAWYTLSDANAFFTVYAKKSVVTAWRARQDGTTMPSPTAAATVDDDPAAPDAKETDTWVPMWTSEIQADDVQPDWDPAVIDLSALSCGDFDAAVQVAVHYSQNVARIVRPAFVGSTVLTLRELLTGSTDTNATALQLRFDASPQQLGLTRSLSKMALARSLPGSSGGSTTDLAAASKRRSGRRAPRPDIPLFKEAAGVPTGYLSVRSVVLLESMPGPTRGGLDAATALAQVPLEAAAAAVVVSPNRDATRHASLRRFDTLTNLSQQDGPVVVGANATHAGDARRATLDRRQNTLFAQLGLQTQSGSTVDRDALASRRARRKTTERRREEEEENAN